MTSGSVLKYECPDGLRLKPMPSRSRKYPKRDVGPLRFRACSFTAPIAYSHRFENGVIGFFYIKTRGYFVG